MTRSTWGRAAFAAGPACLGTYGLIRLIDDEHGPGPDWSLGHLALLAGVVLFVPVFAGLRRMAVRGRGPAARWFAGSALALGLLGVAAVTVQAGIDLVVGYSAADRAGMNELFERIQGTPGMKPAFYTVGPVLFYVGLLLLIVQSAAVRAIEAWRPAVVVAAVAVMAAGLDLIPVGALLLLLALAPLGRRAGTPSAPHGEVRAAHW
ncbi:hypothetical protein [Streptomyces sp. NPDC021096]|uniref:hypothetical protein n=1 Tax=Streptomyces sp. NPDC021096 TaxID=3154792 RepID=UPI0033F95ECB